MERDDGSKTGYVSRRAVTTSGALAAAALLCGGGAARAAVNGGGAGGRGLTLRLPAPTGPHPVGAASLHLIDRSRRDPWDAGGGARDMMVTVLYPARAVPGHPAAPQLTAGAVASYRDIDVRMHGLPAAGVDWAATRTHAYPGAPAQPVRRPVLLYGPGGGDPRTMGSTLAEELASHGYVVVTMDHPGDASEVEFPGGRVRETFLRGDPRTDPELFRALIDTRIADTRFVLDQVEALAAGRNPDASGRPLPTGLGHALDPRRVGAYGHSAGGTATAQALYEDPRIAAAADLEGYLDHPTGELYPVARYGTDRPLLLLGTEGFDHREELDRSWSVTRGRRVGRRRLGGTAHWVFTDYAVTAPQLQAAGLMPRAARTALVGASAPERSVPLVRRSVHGFFARHLPVRG
ncbi:alpha/beta hydrolase [Streptomyces sp. UNOC14_S4]|uniref:alpha/beta hydrolase n=1 Tax=Streptomyces sp. UNOC14_S4 TaxID=2872340 RepID=UPI001E5A2816|nr:alpha/beta hydrolase [Streptomyces sp. UNOC14_S4]